MRNRFVPVFLAILFIAGVSQVKAQIPNLDIEPSEQIELATHEELLELVGPIALYPDELLSIVLPASTFPIQIVQAARFFEKSGVYKYGPSKASLAITKKWDPSVTGLLNYPEILERMSSDLDWTVRLGTAVANQNEDVLKAIQDFRIKAKDAGNLKSDTHQDIVEDEDKIIIRSASKDTICVPDYDPEEVIYRHSYPIRYVYSDPYPLYWYPTAYYPTYWSSFYVSYGFDWFHYRIHRHYYYKKHKGKRPFKTRPWKARHSRIGRPGKRFVRHTSVRRDFKEGRRDRIGKKRRGKDHIGKQRDGVSRKMRRSLRSDQRDKTLNRGPKKRSRSRLALAKDRDVKKRNLRGKSQRLKKRNVATKRVRKIKKSKRRGVSRRITKRSKSRRYRGRRTKLARVNNRRSVRRVRSSRRLRSSHSRRAVRFKQRSRSRGRISMSRGGRPRMNRSGGRGRGGGRGQSRRR